MQGKPSLNTEKQEAARLNVSPRTWSTGGINAGFP